MGLEGAALWEKFSPSGFLSMLRCWISRDVLLRILGAQFIHGSRFGFLHLQWFRGGTHFCHTTSVHGALSWHAGGLGSVLSLLCGGECLDSHFPYRGRTRDTNMELHCLRKTSFLDTIKKALCLLLAECTPSESSQMQMKGK